MDVAFVEHAQHDVHGDHGGQQQPDLIVRGRGKGMGRPLELAAQGRRQLQGSKGLLHRTHGRPQGGAFGHVEGDGGHRELALPHGGRARGAFFHAHQGRERDGLALAALDVDLFDVVRAAPELRSAFQHAMYYP